MERMIFACLIVALVAGCQQAVEEVVPTPGPGVTRQLTAAVQVESVQVHFELDPDGDGSYQVQHPYTEARGVWDEPQMGYMRLMIERPDAVDSLLPGATVFETQTGLFLYQWLPDSLVYAAPDTTGYMDLEWFALFGMNFGSPTFLFDDLRMGRGPEHLWIVIPADSTIASVHIHVDDGMAYITRKGDYSGW